MRSKFPDLKKYAEQKYGDSSTHIQVERDYISRNRGAQSVTSNSLSVKETENKPTKKVLMQKSEELAVCLAV